MTVNYEGIVTLEIIGVFTAVIYHGKLPWYFYNIGPRNHNLIKLFIQGGGYIEVAIHEFHVGFDKPLQRIYPDTSESWCQCHKAFLASSLMTWKNMLENHCEQTSKGNINCVIQRSLFQTMMIQEEVQWVYIFNRKKGKESEIAERQRECV